MKKKFFRMTIWALFGAKQDAHMALEKFLFAAENAKREQLGMAKLLTRKQKIKRFFSSIYPPWKENFVPTNFYQRLFSKGTTENMVACLLRNIITVEMFGLVMYFMLAYKYATRPESIGMVLSIIIHTFLVLMFVFPSLMSYFMLAIHRMLSTKMRTLLLLIMISKSFEGPAMNAVMNIHRVAEGLSCVQTDVNLSLGDVKGRAENFKKIIANKLQNLMIKLVAPINSFRGILRKIDTKVRRIIESIRTQYRALTSLTNLCQRFMKKPYAICKNLFDQLFISCVSTDNFISLPGCDTIKRASSVCQATGSFVEENVCNFPSVAKKVIVDGYFVLVKNLFSVGRKTAETTLFFHIKAATFAEKGLKVAHEQIADIRNLKIRYRQADDGSEDLAVHKKLKESLADFFNQYVAMFELMQTVIEQIFIPYTIIWPFISTALFTYNFNYREEFENNFLTDEFDKIDLDMALRGQTKVLPLNKNEKLQYIRRASWKMTSKERTFYRVRLVMTLILSSTPFCFICMDMGVYSVLSNVYYYTGLVTIDYPSHYEVKVSGTGEAAKMMRSLQEVFSPLTSDIRERDDRWRNCFVEPNPPDENILWTIILLFVISIFLCRFEVWMYRQALALADNFFPDRVRPRALMLYNRILQSRKNILGAMLEEKKKLLADDQIAGREAIIRRGLQSRGFIRVNCSICNEPDLRIADESNTRLCVSCGAYYCIQCFCLRRYCKECNHDMQVIDRVEMYYEDPTDDEESEDELEDNENEEVNSEADLNTKASVTTLP